MINVNTANLTAHVCCDNPFSLACIGRLSRRLGRVGSWPATLDHVLDLVRLG
jgi:hypothetical protein